MKLLALQILISPSGKIAGSSFAILLIATVLRDLARVSLTLAALTLAYVVGMGWLSFRGYFLASSEALPPVDLIAGQLFLALLVASMFIVGAKAWRAIPIRRFLLWHSFRLPMGIIMVLLSYSGELAPEFGWGAGLGEIVVGCWALVYVLLPSSPTPQSIIAWCGIGFLDVFVGMVTAVLTFRSPAQYFPHASQMRIMSTIPMVLIPSFSMAVLTLSTVLVFFRRTEVRETRLRAGEFTPGTTI